MEDEKKIKQDAQKRKHAEAFVNENQGEITRPAKITKQVEAFIKEKEENVIEILSDQRPSEIIMHLDQCIDVAPFFQIEQETANPLDLVGSYHANFALRDMDRIFPSAEGDYFQLFNAHPRKKREDFEKHDNFHIGRLCLFHDVVKVVLEVVNAKKGGLIDGKGGLNIITGEDLLRSVGRLSMMITSADYLCQDESVIPLNMTSGKYLTSRLQGNYRYRGGHKALEEKVARIVGNINKAAPGLLKVGAYENPSILRDRKNLSDYLCSAFPFFITHVLDQLDVEDIKHLAQVNRTFLVLVGFAPPSWLFNDPERKQLVARLAVATALLIRNGDPSFLQGITNTQGAVGSLSHMMSKNLDMRAVKQLETIAYHISGNYIRHDNDKYGMYLPWGGSQAVTLINDGSIRLIFSQGLTILKQITGTDTGKVDLTDEDIAGYLRSLPEDQIVKQIKDAFLNLENVKNPFIGELVILLVGIEGSQNNLAVLHAPMVTDLVCRKEINWNQALFCGKDKVPYFAMAAHKGAKGEKPMVKHSNIIQNFRMWKDYDDHSSDPNFWEFLGGELDLHDKFLKTFFPELDDYEMEDQLILCALIIKYYLLNTFFTDPWGDEAIAVHQKVDELLNRHFNK